MDDGYFSGRTYNIGGIWVDSSLYYSNATNAEHPETISSFSVNKAYNCGFSLNYANIQEHYGIADSYLADCKIDLSVATTLELDASNGSEGLIAVACSNCECVDCDVSISGKLEIQYKKIDTDKIENWMQPTYSIFVFGYDDCVLTNCSYSIGVNGVLPSIDTRLGSETIKVKICGSKQDTSTCQRCEQKRWDGYNISTTNDCTKIYT
jgi:hypothetical protein